MKRTIETENVSKHASKKHVLIVDDEQDIRRFLKTLLENEGYHVTTANGGSEALESLKKETPDLVLIDYFMPEMNGLELCQRIRNNLHLTDLKLAFITVANYGKDITPTDLENLNIDYFIKKPFDNNDLLKKVKELVEE